MHNIVFALLPARTTDVAKHLEALLAAFNKNLEVAPYKKRFSDIQITNWLEKYQTRNLTEIAKKMQSLGFRFGVDDNGLYEETTINPVGRWDYWSPYPFFEPDGARLTRWGKKFSRSACIVSELVEKDLRIAHSLVTPDGKWHDIDDFGYNTALQFEKGIKGLHPDNIEPIAKWEMHVAHVLHDYADHLLLVLDYHF